MVKLKQYEIPSVWAALGAAAGFYTSPLVRGTFIREGVFLVCIVLLSFFRVLAGRELSERIFFTAGFSGQKRFISRTRIFVITFVLGYSLALAVPFPGEPALGLERNRITAVSGILKEDPRLFNDGRGMGSVELKQTAAEGFRASASGSVSVFFPPSAIDRIREFGRSCELYAEGRFVESRNGGFFFRASAVYITKAAPQAEQIRGAVRSRILEKFSPGTPDSASDGSGAPAWGGLASALLLGVRDDLDNDLAASFRDAGCSHVLALSGMHLALLSGILAFFLRRLVGLRPAVLAGSLFIVFYVYLAGGQPSLVRSAIMYLLGAFCVLGYFKRDPFNLLCLAFVIQMVFQTGSSSSASFILSYLALAGILTIGESLHNLLRGKIPEIILSSFSASVGAFIATAPIAALYFGALRPVGIAASLVIVPVASLFMIIALAALVLLFPFPVLFAPFDFVLSLIYRVLEFFVSFAGKAPGLKAAPVTVLIFCLVSAALIVFLNKSAGKYRRTIAPFNG